MEHIGTQTRLQLKYTCVMKERERENVQGLQTGLLIGVARILASKVSQILRQFSRKFIERDVSADSNVSTSFDFAVTSQAAVDHVHGDDVLGRWDLWERAVESIVADVAE